MEKIIFDLLNIKHILHLKKVHKMKIPNIIQELNQTFFDLLIFPKLAN